LSHFDRTIDAAMKSHKATWWVVTFAAIASAGVRGYCLLGTTAAVVFGLTAAAVLFVVWRVFLTARRLRIFQQTVLLLFAVCVFSILTFPAYFSPDLHFFVEDHRIERLTQSQLGTVVRSSQKYVALRFSCRFTKCIVVHVDGTIGSQADLRELRQAIFDNCPHVSSRWLFWRLTVQEGNLRYDDKCDIDFVPTWGGIGIDGKVITRAGQI
jgi:hypothetical protein